MEFEVTDWEEKKLYEDDAYLELRKEWPKGEWDDEPDMVTFKYRDYPCRIFRCVSGYYLCGYVTLEMDHPFNSEKYKFEWDIPVEVHGGITFCEICILKEDASSEVFMIGFDCCHFGDFVPSVQANKYFNSDLQEYKQLIASKVPECSYLLDSTYRNIDFVKNEIKSMVDQAIEAKNIK